MAYIFFFFLSANQFAWFFIGYINRTRHIVLYPYIYNQENISNVWDISTVSILSIFGLHFLFLFVCKSRTKYRHFQNWAIDTAIKHSISWFVWSKPHLPTLFGYKVMDIWVIYFLMYFFCFYCLFVPISQFNICWSHIYFPVCIF